MDHQMRLEKASLEEESTSVGAQRMLTDGRWQAAMASLAAAQSPCLAAAAAVQVQAPCTVGRSASSQLAVASADATSSASPGVLSVVVAAAVEEVGGKVV